MAGLQNFTFTHPVAHVLVLFGCGDAGGYFVDAEGRIVPIPPYPRNTANVLRKASEMIQEATSTQGEVDHETLLAANRLVESIRTELVSSSSA